MSAAMFKLPNQEQLVGYACFAMVKSFFSFVIIHHIVKTTISTQRKLSLAVGILSFAAFVIGQLGDVWGFGGVAKQLTDTILIFVAGINMYFFGSTAQKINEDGKNEKTK